MDYHKEFTKAKIQLDEAYSENPKVSVDGLGTYDLETLKNNTRRHIIDMRDAVDLDDDARAWKNLKHILDSGVFQAKVDAIVSTFDEMDAKRRRGGRPRTK
ncbi:unnamed protein product [marine sediment metagenome]|uniref:Uncharacterized protein n=1 Tax=marine sediment metagenome TaxID=412755 RepID=X0TT92_9ZZZZ